MAVLRHFSIKNSPLATLKYITGETKAQKAAIVTGINCSDDPESAYIDADVRIGMDTVIYPDVYMSGRTVIGEGCRIYNGCRFDNTVVGDNCDMQAVVAIDAVVDDGARVGPYVRLRPNTHIGKNCKIGNQGIRYRPPCSGAFQNHHNLRTPYRSPCSRGCPRRNRPHRSGAKRWYPCPQWNS